MEVTVTDVNVKFRFFSQRMIKKKAFLYYISTAMDKITLPFAIIRRGTWPPKTSFQKGRLLAHSFYQ